MNKKEPKTQRERNERHRNSSPNDLSKKVSSMNKGGVIWSPWTKRDQRREDAEQAQVGEEE